MIIVPNISEAIWIDAVTGKIPASPWTLRLFTAISPALGNTTLAEHLTEADGGGYAAVPLDPSLWETTPGTPTMTVYPKQTFTLTGGLTGNPSIVGYHVTRADGALVYAEMLPEPFTPVNPGDFLDVTPVLTLRSATGD